MAVNCPCVQAGSATAGSTEAQEPVGTLPPAKQLGTAEKEQMRKADRIIMSVLQKVMPLEYSHAGVEFYPV